jgi:membrane glycosyltransferase
MNGVEDNSISEIPTRGGGLDAHRPPLNSKTAISRRMFSMPPIHRVSMAPSAIDRRPLRRLWRRLFTSQKRGDREGTRREQGGGAQAEWRKAATKRRVILAGLVAAQTAVAAWSLAQTFPTPHLSALESIIVAIFSVLFSWISFSFLSNIAGFWMLWRRSPAHRHLEPSSGAAQPLRSRTALVMPICNEEVARCFAGVAAIYQSLGETGELDKFDFFILSDSSETARQLEEIRAWKQTCEALDGFGKIFYRHRKNNIKRKSGNIADFLRRWSKNYDYMVVLDADSLMSGEIIVRLARTMDCSPQVGIIQTAPTIVNRESLFARVQQFASRVYGPLFGASLHFWQLGESYYWGHNAIIRIAPFVKHCGLARLPGEPPLGGEILSHDFVEAALMGRTGLEVWLADDWVGSYEESPPNILDELKRDRRWCQGNLQHLRLLFGEGIRFGHRAIMAMGVMAYASALLWAVFLILSSAEVVIQWLTPPIYFSRQPSLFPNWPVWHPELAIALLTTTGILLVLPKFLSFALILKQRQAAGFGGPWRLAVSIFLEIVYSTLMGAAAHVVS